MAGVDTGLIKHEGYDSNGEPREVRGAITEKAAHVADVGIPNQAHNRYLDGVTATTRKETTFDSIDNVRAYRVRPRRTAYSLWSASTAYSVGDIVHPTSANNLVYEVTAVRGTGVTAGTEPTWPDVIGETVDDDSNPGVDGVTWTARPAEFAHIRCVEDAANDPQADAWLADASSSASQDVEFKTMYDGEWSEWVELSKSPDDIPLSRLDFIATTDTWEIEVQTR